MCEDKLDRLAEELFRTIARFEYALKAAAFHNGDGPAEPNWTALAQSVHAIFDDSQDAQLREALSYMLSNPPESRLSKTGKMEWREVAASTALQSDRVLIYVRRVRNNLFHGGKFNGRWFEPQRSGELLRHSLSILNACLDASDEVRDAYNG